MTIAATSTAVDLVAADTAAGLVIPGVRRCILRIETQGWKEGRSASATTHPDDVDRVDPDVAFRIASVTKLVTATAVLALVDRGQCRLDDVAGDYLPTSVVGGFRDRDGVPYAARLTLRQLLDHTSGLPNFFMAPPILDAIRAGRGQRRFAPMDLVDLAASMNPPSAPPGTVRAYTDTGFVLAGLIVERLTGATLDAAYRRLVLDPAGMGATWLESSAEAPRRGAIARHDADGLDLSDMDPTVDWAGGGLVSTAADLARLLRGLVGGDLVSADAWSEMTRWRPGPEGFYDEYGLGVGRYTLPAATFVGHHGVWGAFAFWSPELDATVTGTVNTARVDRRPLLARVADALAAARG